MICGSSIVVGRPIIWQRQPDPDYRTGYRPHYRTANLLKRTLGQRLLIRPRATQVSQGLVWLGVPQARGFVLQRLARARRELAVRPLRCRKMSLVQAMVEYSQGVRRPHHVFPQR